ncbi:hypothetical protein HPP92_004235 [Vanilla planifolia]|uniref:IST1-like protein n=1 Tax=Vanilla planifolia TaxID=51239 RepID=A0A835VEB0_VANPL|nr:hypothetical protein HPP92_004235 [Vanilla planifolia]
MLTKKTLLHKSFKAAKCKTSLKLAVSRIKLLKNRREIQVKQLRRELAQLLAAGQEQTARIRVEHVVREEKTMSAYDLIEIYCELIVARLPIIESQKNCPIDLKEAISSVIFASPRCADIPELMDVRKHFVAKYGKEFVTSALELRPECGVNHLIVEKLSAKAPDIQTKVKILSAIAKEHDIKWDSKGLEDELQNSKEDLMNGPSYLSNANMVPIQPFNLNFSAEAIQKESASKIPHVDIASMTTDLNYSSLPNARASTPQLSSRQNDPRVSENRGNSDMMDSYPSEEFSVNKANWRMEFKDAASAAQAAAESAEKASIAARAAVELAGQGNISRQNSNESHGNISKQNSNKLNGSSIGSSLDEKPNRLPSSKLKGSESVNVEYGQVKGVCPKDESRVKMASVKNEDFSFYKGKVETFDSSMGSFPVVESQEGNQNYNEAESVKENVKLNYDGSPSASSAGTDGDESIWVQTAAPQHGKSGNLKHSSSEIGVGERHFGYDNEQISFDHPGVVFDEYDSEGNDAKGNLSNSFWKEQDDLSSRFDSINIAATSSISSNSHRESNPFTAEIVTSPKIDDTLPVTFDDSDGYSSELEDDLNKQLPTKTLQNTSSHRAEEDSITDSHETLPESTLKSQSLLGTDEKGSA